MAPNAGAAVLSKDAYGLKPGSDASFVIVKAPNGAAAVAATPAQRALVRGGEFQYDLSSLRIESKRPRHHHGVAMRATS